MRRSRRYHRWTATELLSLRVAWHDPAWSWGDIAHTLQRSIAACKIQAKRCCIRPGRRPR